MRASLIQETFAASIADFVAKIRVEYLANITVPQPHVEKIGKSSGGGGYKGGKPPVDYSAVEMFVDLQAAIKADRWSEAYRLYIALRRITNL